MKKVTSDINGADRHVDHIPGEGNLNTKLIKTANKPWLLGHIKPKNAEAEKVGLTCSVYE